MKPVRTAYQRDFYAWSQAQARALRERRLDQLDLENLSEEVEDLANSLRRELFNRLRVILVHLLKCQYQPERRSPSWESTLLEQRLQVGDLLEQSPSLKREVPELAAKAYKTAPRYAALQMRLDKKDIPRIFPARCPWTADQIFDLDFVPSPHRRRS